jgi:lipopolysaccharide export system protein LptA
MKIFIVLAIFWVSVLISQELKVKANKFNADEKAGISIFEGDVNIIKGNDELNASKVTIYTNDKHQPTKYIASGKVSFKIKTKKGSRYEGVAGKVIFLPIAKEYHFFKNVYLKQLDEKKEILGDEVVLKTTEGKAYAKGVKTEPVIMIFEIPQDKED